MQRRLFCRDNASSFLTGTSHSCYSSGSRGLLRSLANATSVVPRATGAVALFRRGIASKKWLRFFEKKARTNDGTYQPFFEGDLFVSKQRRKTTARIATAIVVVATAATLSVPAVREWIVFNAESAIRFTRSTIVVCTSTNIMHFTMC